MQHMKVLAVGGLLTLGGLSAGCELWQKDGEPAKAVEEAKGAMGMYDKPGFKTRVEDGRLWVFREGSKDWEEFEKSGEPTKMVTRINAGPDGMTIRSSDAETIDAYLAAGK